MAISSSLAERLDLQVGDKASARATRGDPPTARLRTEFEIVHIVQRGWLQGVAALAPVQFVSEVEAFFDNYALPHYEVETGRPMSERTARFESFRIYAADIRQVAELEAKLEKYLAVIVRSRVGDIAPILALDRNIGRALNILAVCGALGLGAALLALFWANVERKRVILSMLALMGARPAALAAFPIIQAVVYALGGILASALLFAAGTVAFNTMFADALAQLGGGAIVIGDPFVILAMIGGLILIAVTASAAAAWRASGTDPAIVIRGGG